MQLTGAIDVETVQSEEEFAGQERANTLFAGTIEDGRVGTENDQGEVVCDTDTYGIDPGDC